MATFTITTTAAEDATLAFALPLVNAQRLADGKPPFTTADLVDFFVRQQVMAYRQGMLDDETTRVRAAFEAAPAAKRQQVKTVLGV